MCVCPVGAFEKKTQQSRVWAGRAPLDTRYSIKFSAHQHEQSSISIFSLSADAIKANCAPGAATSVPRVALPTTCPLLSAQSNLIKFRPQKFWLRRRKPCASICLVTQQQKLCFYPKINQKWERDAYTNSLMRVQRMCRNVFAWWLLFDYMCQS